MERIEVRTKLTIATLVALAAIAIGCGMGDGTGIPSGRPMNTNAAGGAPAAQTTAAPPPAIQYGTPTVKDFKLTVKILRKQCFGSAGCNVNYRIEVAYVGSKTLDPAKTYEVTYEVKGAEDTAINTFTVTGDHAQVREEEFASTSRSSATLTAVVTAITEQ